MTTHQFLPAVVSCDATSPNYVTPDTYWANTRLFSPKCAQDSDGPVISQRSDLEYSDCIWACIENRECKAVTYRYGLCYQKYTAGNLIASEDASADTWTSPESDNTITCPAGNGGYWDGFKISCDVDYPGNNIDVSTQPTANHCVDKCWMTSGCLAAVYDGSRCFLKNKVERATVVPGRIAAASANYQPPTAVLECDSKFPTANGQVFTIKCSTDYPGSDLPSSEQDTFEDCVNDCSITDGCIAVVYNGASCYKKSEYGAPGYNGGLMAAINEAADNVLDDLECSAADPNAPSTYTSGGVEFDVRCSTDLTGNDLRSTYQSTFKKCIADCAATTECVAVVYTGSSACYLKSKVGEQTASGNNAAILNGYQDPVEPEPFCPRDNGKVITSGDFQYHIYCDAEYPGGDVGSVQADNFPTCVAACNANYRCVDVSYIAGGKACYMKAPRMNGITLDARNGIWTAQQLANPENPRVICPNVAPATIQANGRTFEIACGNDYPGGDIGFVEVLTIKECLQACTTLEGCKAVTFRGAGCYMKNVANPPAIEPNSPLVGAKLAEQD
jgi:hypothetical protein